MIFVNISIPFFMFFIPRNTLGAGRIIRPDLGIAHIFGLGCKSQIRNPIIRWIPINVINRGWWPFSIKQAPSYMVGHTIFIKQVNLQMTVPMWPTSNFILKSRIPAFIKALQSFTQFPSFPSQFSRFGVVRKELRELFVSHNIIVSNIG
jgi:hypothetical protein